MFDILRVLFIACLLISLLGCGRNGGDAGAPPHNENAVRPQAQASPSKPFQQATPEETPKPGIIATLKKSKGKYPYELKLLDNEEMRSRLQKLLGVDFAAMKANWSVETPIDIENGILMTSGCEKHNCGGNIYYMVVDLGRDNINVYHIKNGQQVYTEGPRIDLPKKFADEVESEQN